MPPKRGKAKKAIVRKRAVAMPQDDAELTAVLGKILTPDNDIIKDGMRVLRVFLESPVCVPALMQQLTGAAHVGVRQLAAIALRKCVREHWEGLAPNMREVIRVALLGHLDTEQNINVRNSCVSLVSAIARMDMPKGQWPELIENVFAAISSPHAHHNDFGLNLLRLLFAAVPRSVREHRHRALEAFRPFVLSEHPKLQTRALRGMHSVYHALATREDLASLNEMMPVFLQVFRSAIANEETDTLYPLFEIMSSAADPDLPLGDENCAQVFVAMCDALANQEVPFNIRSKALQFLIDETNTRPANITRLDLANKLLETIFTTFTQVDDESFSENEAKPHRLGVELFVAVQENLPKQFVVQACLPHIFRMLESADFRERTAALLAFTTLMRECFANVLELSAGAVFRQVIGAARALFADPSPLVVTAACVLICNLADTESSDHPIFELHAEIVPDLMALLRSNAHPVVQSKALLALDAFCETLGTPIVAYYNDIMALMQGYFTSTDPTVLCFAVSVVKSVAVACRSHFEPYFQALVDFLLPMLDYTDEHLMELRAKATECLGKAAHAVGMGAWPEKLASAFDKAITGFQIMCDNQYLLHTCTFTFFERVIAACGAQTPKDLRDTVIAHALATLQSSDGIEDAEEDDDEGGNIRGFDDDSEAEEEERAESAGLAGLSDEQLAARAAAEAENAEDEDEDEDDDDDGDNRCVIAVDAFDVKLEAAQLIVTALSVLGDSYDADLLKRTRLYAMELAAFPYDLMRRSMLSVLQALGEHTLELYPMPAPFGTVPHVVVPLHPEAEAVMRDIFETVVAVIVSDRAGNVVTIAIEVFSGFLKTFGLAAMPVDYPSSAPQIPYLTDFMNTLELIAQEKAKCQTSRDLVDIDADSGFDVFDSFGDLLGVMAESMGPAFLPLFNKYLPYITSFADPRRPNIFRNTAIGTIAEMLHYTGAVEHENAETLAQIASTYIADPNIDVADNAIYLAGVLVEMVGARVESSAPVFVKQLMEFLGRAEAAEREGTATANDINCGRDNTAAALVRILLTLPHAVDHNVVVPAIFALLPLRHDVTEGNLVYPQLPKVYALAPELVAAELPKIVAAYAETFTTSTLLDEVRAEMVAWLSHLTTLFPGQIEAHAQTLPDVYREALAHNMANGGAPPAE
jgi:hypothetical protein